MRKANLAMALALAVGLAACGGGSEPEAAGGAAAPAEAPDAAPSTAREPTPPPSTAAADASLQRDEIDAYVRGMQKEIELLRAAGEKVKQARAAKDEQAELSAITGMAMGDFDTPSAAAAGLPVPRWQEVKRKVAAVIGGVDTRAQMQGMVGSTEGLTPEQVAEHQRNAEALLASIPDPYAGLEPAVVEALKARHDELARLNAESIGLRMSVQ
jgi:hypothetical protein